MSATHIQLNEEADQVITQRHAMKTIVKRRNQVKQGPNDVLVQQQDQKFWSQKRIYNLKYVGIYITVLFFNLGPVYLSYLIVSIFRMFSAFKQNKDLSIKSYFRHFVIDYFLASCVTSMYVLFSIGVIHYSSFSSLGKQYFHWSIACIIFIVLFTTFVTYDEIYRNHIESSEEKNQQKKKKEEVDPNEKYQIHFHLSYLISSQNYLSLGLGRSQNDYVEQVKNRQYDKTHLHVKLFQKQYNHIIESLNVDDTLVYFSLQSEQNTSPPTPRKSNGQANQNEQKVVQTLQNRGFRGSRHIYDNFLLPHYIYTRKYLLPNNKLKYILAALLAILKIILPTAIYIRPINPDVLLYSLLFVGFYLFFAQTIFELTINADLKTKNHLFYSLQQLISIQNTKEKGKENQILDISCTLSLQSWDLMRRITLLLDKHILKRVNTILGFLVLYGQLCFVAFVLCRFQLDLFKDHNYCKEDIFTYSIHIDTVIIVAICFMRIYEGNKFNETFSATRDMVHRLTAVYEDLYTLFDFYFSSKVQELLTNDLYKEVIGLIHNAAEVKQAENLAQLQSASSQPLELSPQNFSSNQSYNKNHHHENPLADPVQTYAQEKVQELRSSMLKISKQVDKDELKHTEKLVGLYDTDSKKFTRVVIVVAFSYIPSLFKKLSRYINQMT